MDKHRMCECCKINFLLKDMKGDLCIVCYNFIQTRQNQRITELEAKLAESEKAFDTICAKYEKKSEQIFEIIKRKEECSDAYDLLSKENDQLKTKLAEEKNRNKKLNHEAQKYYEDAYCNNFQNQTAITKLEEVKQLCDGIMLSEKYISNQNTKPFQSIIDYIDQQIKELKGEK